LILIIIFCFRPFRQLIVFWFHFSVFDLLEIVLCCFSFMMLLVYFLNSSFDISFIYKKKELPLWFFSICFLSGYHNHMIYFMSFADLLRIRSPFITQVMCLLHYLELTHADFLSILIQIHTSKDSFFSKVWWSFFLKKIICLLLLFILLSSS